MGAPPAMLARMSDAILLTNAAGDAAEIAPFGAELRAWRAGGVDLVWAKDPNIWDQTAPILFPVVGATRDGCIRVGDKTYPLGLHGFAWKKRFEIVERRDDYLRLALEDDDETRALYPFAFRLEVEFRLGPSALENSLVVTNTGATPLPYACGLHPAFRWPFAGSTAQHSIVFEKDERPTVPIIGPGGLFTRRKRPVPLVDRRLPLWQALMTNEALCFLDARSRRLILTMARARGSSRSSRISRISPCGRCRRRRSCASKPGPAMATRRDLRATFSKSRPCASSPRASARATAPFSHLRKTRAPVKGFCEPEGSRSKSVPGPRAFRLARREMQGTRE